MNSTLGTHLDATLAGITRRHVRPGAILNITVFPLERFKRNLTEGTFLYTDRTAVSIVAPLEIKLGMKGWSYLPIVFHICLLAHS